jgi:RNA polymerase sigma-70 factor (ECF subfamily)
MVPAPGALERRLEAATARLPQKDREVLLLVGAEGLAPAEAAAVLGLSADVARKRLQRARERLATEMRQTQPTARLKAG